MTTPPTPAPDPDDEDLTGPEGKAAGRVGRRAFLCGAAWLGLAGCSSSSVSGSPVTSPSTVPSTVPSTAAPVPSLSAEMTALEKRYGARIGVFAQVVGGAAVSHRPAERFPMCSTFKVFAVAAVLAESGAGLDRRIRYRQSDVLEYAPITSKHVADGMTVRELCDATLRYSDNTAANLLLREVGGPRAGVTALLRSLGDPVTRLDRTEPALNTAIPGDERDTTTPEAYARDLRYLTLAPQVPADRRALLLDWMTRNTTGDGKIRAAVPKGWSVADKTGSGSYGTSNDVALLRPPSGAPIVLTVFTTYRSQGATPEPTLIRRVTASALEALGVA